MQSGSSSNGGGTTSSTPPQAQARPQKEQQPRQQKEQVKQQHNQQKEQAHQQKEQVKEQQKRQQEEAKQRQKEQKEHAKNQQKQQKEQARQQKQQAKLQQKQQKEQARQQKEQLKHGPKAARGGASDPQPTPSRAASTTETTRSGSHTTHSVYNAPEGGAISGKTATGEARLTKDGSQSTLRQVNAARARMSGVNRKPLPPGDVTVHPNGRLTVDAAGGRQYGVRSNGTISSYRDHEKVVSFDPRGRVSSIRAANLSVRRGPNGERTIESRRTDNSRLVSTSRRSGYVERNVAVGNKTYIQRTTVINQRVTTNTLVAYNYGGVALTHFVTPVFYSPGFYGWAYHPWAVPMSFSFGWLGASWYAAPNPYFAAYPAYPGAAFWLTDYMLGEALENAHQLDQEALASEANDPEYAADATSDADDFNQPDTLQADATTPVTVELKDQIAEEVKQQIAYDNYTATKLVQESSYDELPAVLGQPNHVFVASSYLDVSTTDQQECGLQPGDVLRLVSAAASDATIVELLVASSKRMDCPAGVTVGVSLQDVQEMQNAFRSRIESGLGSLMVSQGHGGIPIAPPDAVAAPPQPALPCVMPVPVDELTTMLEEQRQEADQAEAEVVKQAFNSGS
jgi:hypothetical protein